MYMYIAVFLIWRQAGYKNYPQIKTSNSKFENFDFSIITQIILGEKGLGMSPTQRRPRFFSRRCKSHPWAFGGSWISLSKDTQHLLFLWTMWKQYQKGNWRHPQVSISRFAKIKLGVIFLLLCLYFHTVQGNQFWSILYWMKFNY